MGQLIFPNVPMLYNVADAVTPSSEPIWSEQAYVPGAVNPDPSIQSNPNPTVAGTLYDVMQVLNDPLAENPVFNATDTPATASSAGVATGLPAWVLIPAALLVGWLLLK